MLYRSFLIETHEVTLKADSINSFYAFKVAQNPMTICKASIFSNHNDYVLFWTEFRRKVTQFSSYTMKYFTFFKLLAELIQGIFDFQKESSGCTTQLRVEGGWRMMPKTTKSNKMR